MRYKSNENTIRQKDRYSEIEVEEKISDLYKGEGNQLEEGHYDYTIGSRLLQGRNLV